MEQALRRREGRLFGCAKFSPPSQNKGNLDLFPREEDWSLTQMKRPTLAQTDNRNKYMYSPLMELIDQPLSSAIVAESLNLSKTTVAQDGVTDKCNPVFQLQGQLEMKLVSIC